MIELEFRSVDFYGGRKTGERPSKQGRQTNFLFFIYSTHMKYPSRGLNGERRAYYRNTTHASHHNHKANYNGIT
jgi:hypothetical protein